MTSESATNYFQKVQEIASNATRYVVISILHACFVPVISQFAMIDS